MIISSFIIQTNVITIVNYDRQTFIIQATGLYIILCNLQLPALLDFAGTNSRDKDYSFLQTFRCSASGQATGFIHKHQTRLERPARDKDSSFLQTFSCSASGQAPGFIHKQTRLEKPARDKNQLMTNSQLLCSWVPKCQMS